MENNYIEVIYKNNKYKILQYSSESNIQFNKRLTYIKTYETTDMAFNEVERLSKIWMCITMKKCKYNKDVYKIMPL
jgi:hypothetical protein